MIATIHTNMTLAGAGKRAHLAPGDRYRPAVGRPSSVLINLRKHGRTFQGASQAGPCVVDVVNEKQVRVSDVASHARSEPQLLVEKGLFQHLKQAYRASQEAYEATGSLASDSSHAASGGAFLETVVATNRGVMLRGRACRGQSEG
jgi:flavin reductase (DIM6/NTAB) family NADH-FMN oxidoreductase RutF